jgi:glycosyltransferase involved in cell wall biosynthesis
VRVGLINDGMYPYQRGVDGTWCHRLVRGLPEHAFHLAAITRHESATAVFYPPTNTLTLTPIATADAPKGPTRGRAALTHRRTATHAAVLLCRSMLDDTPHSVAMFRSALRRLAVAGGTGIDPLNGVPLAAVLLDAWHAAHPTGVAALPRPALPAANERAADEAAALLERAVRPLATALPMTDVSHTTDASLAGLVAIAAKWRTGAPFVLSEHRPYVEHGLLDGAGSTARAIVLRFLRALARLAYMEASAIVVATEQSRRWALDHGADREKVSLVPYGVDPHSCPTLRGEPNDPLITWLGPDRDLPTMLAALQRVRGTQGARLIVAGPASSLVDSSTTDTISFLGPVSHRRSAYATGQIVVLSGRDESMPYALIEAMMCGRPTICVDDGSLAPMIGMGALIVPPNDPDALAAACLTLLGDPLRRRQLSHAAGHRARNRFGLRMVIDRYRDAYETAALDTAAPTERLVSLAPEVPAHAAS